MTRIIILISVILLGLTGMWFGGKGLYNSIYLSGFNEANRLTAIQEEMRRQAAKVKINEIEKQALDKIAALPKIDLEKVIADVRKTNPGCRLIVPRGVSDALKARFRSVEHPLQLEEGVR